MNVKRIGMIVAVEIDAVLQNMGCTYVKKETIAQYDLYHYKVDDVELIVLNCGAGEIAAASGTQFLITAFSVDMIVNFGVVGGLTNEMATTRLCIVEKVVHYDFDTSAVDEVEVGRYLQYPDIYIPTTKALVEKARSICPALIPVICASGDKFVGDFEKKVELHNKFKADICEMEAAGIVLTCNRNDIPVISIKCVSDSISGGAEEFVQCIRDASKICFDVTLKIISSLNR